MVAKSLDYARDPFSFFRCNLLSGRPLGGSLSTGVLQL